MCLFYLALLKEHVSSGISKRADKSDRKHSSEDDYKPGSKTTATDGSRTNKKLYPDLSRETSAYPDASDVDPHKKKDKLTSAIKKQNESSPSKYLIDTNPARLGSSENIKKNLFILESPSSSKKSNQGDVFIAYAPDLPPNIESNQALENMIRECLERKHKQEVLEVKCNTKLGIGTVYLRTEDDKNNVTNVIRKILIEQSDDTTISFVDELELVSYVVIQTNDMKNIPLPNDICRRWTQLYKPSSPPKCEQLSVQFPNIFQITTSSLDDLLKAASVTEFSIDNQLATVYFRADYCFLEDLPRTTNIDRLKEAIRKQISDRCMSKELIHIQYNKDAANAVVLTSGRARIWSLRSSIQIDGRDIMKKYALACRVLIENVPKGLSISLIKNHKIFSDDVVRVVPSTEHVIFELGSRDTYETCVGQGALRIEDHVLGIKPYTLSSNPEDREIDAENLV